MMHSRSDSAEAPLPGRFVVLVGIDGSGKSTLLRKLAEAGVRATSWHELRSHDVPATLAPDAPTHIKNRLSPLARAMFIGGHLVAQYAYLVRPALEQGHDVVLDSYYYKLLAKERLLGFAHRSLEDLCAELPQPDALVLVDTPPEVSWVRKNGNVSPYEHFDDPSEASYLQFQTQIAESLRAATLNVPSISLDGAKPPDHVLNDALDALDTLLGERKAS